MKEINDHFIAIVLCAGFGTRLKPLTYLYPKVACPVINKPVAFMNIEKLFQAGFEFVHCNTHYLSYIAQEEIKSAARYFGYDPNRIIFWHEEEILETGGGIIRIQHELFKQDIKNSKKDLIVMSGDIVGDFPLTDMISRWETRLADETSLMCTRSFQKMRKDLTWLSADQKYVLGFGESFSEQAALHGGVACVWTTYQIIHHSLVNNALIEKKSSVDIIYRKSLSEGKKIINLSYADDLYWFDIGSFNDYHNCINFLSKENNPISSLNFLNQELLDDLKICKEQGFGQNQVTKEAVIFCFRDIDPIYKQYIPINKLTTKYGSEQQEFYFLI